MVDRIFEEGVKHADAFAMVLSEHSVNKPWVKEELNAAVVKRVNKGSKIIPVILGDCEVPEALRSTQWQRIKDPKFYDTEFDRIVDALLGVRQTPTLGKLPDVAKSIASTYPELSNVDAAVLEATCSHLLKQTDVHAFVASTEICKHLRDTGISDEAFYESLEILGNRGYFERSKEVSPVIRFFQVTDRALNDYVKRTIPDYLECEKRIAAIIVNEHLDEPGAISDRTGVPLNIVRHVLDWFAQQRLIDVHHTIGGHMCVERVHPELKRRLD